MSEYREHKVGTTMITVKAKNSSIVYYHQSFNLPPGPMTLVLMGSMNTSTTANWFADSWAYQPNTAAVRFLHVAQGGPAVDVTALTTPGTNVAWKQIPFGSVGDFQTVPSSPDPLKFAIVDAARNTVGSANISSLASEQSYTVLLLGSPSRYQVKVVGGYNPIAPDPSPSPEIFDPEEAISPEPVERIPFLALLIAAAGSICGCCACAQCGLLRSCYINPIDFGGRGSETETTRLAAEDKTASYGAGGLAPAAV
jgi:hypothetical protein